MAGGDPNSQGNRYTHNDAAFVEYNTRLQSSNLTTFTSAAFKFTEWLGSDKAYYPNARVPIVSIIESAHANVCRIQGDPSAHFVLDRALPALEPWYQPYSALLKQVGSHLNYFEPELRARLRPLIENAGIKIVQVPTLTENTRALLVPNSCPPETCDNDRPTPTTAKEDITPVEAPSQTAGPSKPIQPPGTTLSATMPEPQRKGRRRLNKAIFDIDTVAALRTKTQAGHQTIGVNNPTVPKVIVRQEAAGVVHSQAQLPEAPPESPPTERTPNVDGSTREHPQTQAEYAHQNGPLLEVTIASSSLPRTEDSLLPEGGTDVEQPREKSPIRLLGKAGPADSAKLYDHDGQPEPFESPVANPPPVEVEICNVNEEPPGSSGPPREPTPEPMDTNPSTDPPVLTPNLEESGVEKRIETPKQPQGVPGIVKDMGSDVPPHPPGDITTCSTIRRNSGDAVGGERNSTSSEPPVGTDAEVTTVVAPLTPPTVTPTVATCGPPDSATSVPSSLWVTHGIQRSTSDMMLESENEASSSPQPDKRAAEKRTYHHGSLPSLEPPPPAELQTETLAADPHEGRVIEETMPPIQDISLASPGAKPNPFATLRIPIHPTGPFPPFVRSPTHPPAASRASTSTPTPAPQVPLQETPKQRVYSFSAVEIRTLVAARGSDEGSGPNQLVFCLDWDIINGIVKWRSFKAGQGLLDGSVCLSLACYPVDLVATLMSTAKENQPLDALIRQAHIRSSWPVGPTFRSALKDGSGKSYAIPPFSTTEDNFIDISESATPGTNTYTIEDNGQILSSWLFAVYAHTPTIAYFDAIRTRVEKQKKWLDTLTSFTTYSLPAINYDALQSPDPE